MQKSLSLSISIISAVFWLGITWVMLSTTVAAQDNSLCADEVVVQPGDTLSALAIRYYGSPLAYPRIVNATNARAAADNRYPVIANPNRLEIGWRLCIPASNEAVTPSNVTPTLRATVTPTPMPTLAPGELHPLAIERMRRQEYPGSALVVEQTLQPGANYDRYIVSYRSEGYKIYALLTVPRGTKPASGWPVVIFNHGYIPPAQYRTTERYIAYVDAFARNGYIVLRSDYRGHGSSEGEATGSYSSPAYTVDVLNAVAAIKQYGDADPERIGMWGHSMGGQITLRSMVVSEEIKAGVIWAGVVASYPDLTERWRRTQTTPPTTGAMSWRQGFIDQYGSPEEEPEFWASISPNSYLADLSGPIQLHHGTNDTSVPVEFSETLNAQIRAAGGVVEYYVYTGDDHNLSRNLNTALARSVAFFDRYVK
jgi:uncharacterized protein